MNVTREDVMEALGRNVTRGMTLTALADAGLRKQDYARLRTLLAQLTGEGAVAISISGGAFALPTSRAAKEPARTPKKETSKKERPAEVAPRKARLPWVGRRA